MNVGSSLRRKVKSAGVLCNQALEVARNQGASAALRHCLHTAKAIVSEKRLGERTPGAQVTADFDRRYGVQTTGLASMTSMTIDSPNYLYATVYKASDPDRFVEILGRLRLPHGEFTFLDLGSGKGLTLLLASAFPFARIRGVEFAKELHEIAQENIRRYPEERKQCRDIASVRADATEYEFPEDPLVIYLYHPFEQQVMGKVLERLKKSYERRPRQIVILYLQPALRSLLDGTGFLRAAYERQIDEIAGRTTAGYMVYLTREAAAAGVIG